MARVGFFVLPNTGGMNACLQLARDLKGRGHDVVYLGLVDSRDYIETNGFDFYAVFEKHFPHAYFQQDISRKGLITTIRSYIAKRKHFHCFFECILAGGDREYLGLLDRLNPDLLIFASGDPYVEWSAAMSFRKGIKGVYFYSTLRPSEQTGLPPINVSLTPTYSLYCKVASYFSWRKAELLNIVGTRYFRTFSRALFSRYGYDPELYRSQYRIPFEYRLPEIVAWPIAFEFPGADFPGRYYSEALICMERRQPDFPWEKLDDNRPLIYCALGTYIWFSKDRYKEFFRTVIQASSIRPDWHWVCAIGNALDTKELYPLPPNVIVVTDAPQIELLKRARLMICHGGANTVKECIYFGVPMIIFPFGADHPGYAARVVYHGLGVRGELRKLSVQYLQDLIEAVDRSSYFRSQVKIMQAKFREIGEAKPAVGLIETVLRG